MLQEMSEIHGECLDIHQFEPTIYWGNNMKKHKIPQCRNSYKMHSRNHRNTKNRSPQITSTWSFIFLAWYSHINKNKSGGAKLVLWVQASVFSTVIQVFLYACESKYQLSQIIRRTSLQWTICHSVFSSVDS